VRYRGILAGVASFALAAAGAMTFAPSVAAGPAAGTLLPAHSAGQLVRDQAGSVHALVLARPLARPSGLARDAAPATVAKAFLAGNAKAFGATASSLRPIQTVGFGSRGSTVRFQQTMGGLPVLGGELVVSMDAAGSLQSITGEATKGSLVPDGRLAASAATTVDRARAFVTKRTGAKHLRATRVDTVVFNPHLLGLPSGADVNLRADRFHVTGPGVSYSVFVHRGVGVLGGFSNTPEAGNNRAVCAAHNDVFAYPSDAYCVGTNPNITVTRYEGGPVSSDVDTNNVFNNLGYTQRAYTDFAGYDLAPHIGLTGAEAGGSDSTKKLRATVHFCSDFHDCPMQNAFWNDTFDSDTGELLGGQMYYGVGVTQDDITGHEVSHGVTSATSNLLYWFQSGAINESMSDVFGELIDLVDSRYGSPTESATNAWKIGEGSSLGVIRSMKSPGSVPQWDGSKGQPDKMTSTNWWDLGWDEDSGGVHENSGVGNKTAYLIAAGGTFNGQTVRKLGYDKTFAIYWSTENLLTSGADYRDLYTALPTACTKIVGTRSITADDCLQVRKAVAATELAKSARATDNLPVRTTYCSTGQSVNTAMYQGFDATPSGWVGGGLTKQDYGFDYVKTGADSALVFGGSAQPMRQTTGVTVPAGGKLRITYSMYLFPFGTQLGNGYLRYRLTPTGALHSLPTPSVNRGPWGISPGWSSAKWDLGPLAGKRIYLHFNTDDSSESVGLFVDDVRVYSCG
jgi:bacillolysin